mmetsp:Transcript_27133/g.51069  ORF Transcript_27133/g.51069 Transcript_27133/m.51069 type:complete len:679 (+) Transcript_27133:46-2082(+)
MAWLPAPGHPVAAAAPRPMLGAGLQQGPAAWRPAGGGGDERLLLGGGVQPGRLGWSPTRNGAGLPGVVTMKTGAGLLGTPPKPMDLLYPGLPQEEQFWKHSPGAAAGEHWLPPASTVVHIATPQLSPPRELALERSGSQFITPPRQRAGVPVPVQPLMPTNGLAASASKAPVQIETALAEAERELAENPNLVVAESPAPALCWLDAKIRSLKERGVKRTEQQTYLEELRRIVTGAALPSQPSETLFAEDVGSLDERWKRVASSNRQQMEWAYEHEELHRELSHLRRQQKASDDEREELRRLQEVECEGYLKDVEHAAEALEEGSRRAKQAEESVVQAKLRTEALEEQLQEALAEKQRISEGAAVTQAELVSAKEMSQKVVDNCRVLQSRVKELEAERALDRDRHRRLEDESHTLHARNRELEVRVLELEERLRYAALPSQVPTAARSSVAAATSSAPASGRAVEQVFEICDEKGNMAVVLQSGLATASNVAAEIGMPAPHEELSTAELARQSITSGNALAMLPSAEPKALGPPAAASTPSKEADSIRARIKELEREMTAVHQKTLCLDGIQPAPRAQYRHSAEVAPAQLPRHTQPRRSSAPHFSLSASDEIAERPMSISPAQVPRLSLPMGPLADALESAAPSFAPLDSCDDEAADRQRCHTFGTSDTGYNDQVLRRS